MPIHLTRIKKWHDLIGSGVDRFGLGVFAVVAGLAGEGKILGAGFAAFADGIAIDPLPMDRSQIWLGCGNIRTYLWRVQIRACGVRQERIR